MRLRTNSGTMMAKVVSSRIVGVDKFSAPSSPCGYLFPSCHYTFANPRLHLRPLVMARPFISDLVHLTPIFLLSSPSCHRSLYGYCHPVSSIITFTAPLSSAPSSSLVISMALPTRHNTSLILLTSVTSDTFTLTHPNITFSLQGSVFLIHLPTTSALSSFVSGYRSGLNHRISIPSPSSCSPTTPHMRIHRVIDDLKFCPTSQPRARA